MEEKKCPKMSQKKKKLVHWQRGATICPDCGGSLVTSPLLSVVPIVLVRSPSRETLDTAYHSEELLMTWTVVAKSRTLK
jgi:hypothetical protein